MLRRKKDILALEFDPDDLELNIPARPASCDDKQNLEARNNKNDKIKDIGD